MAQGSDAETATEQPVWKQAAPVRFEEALKALREETDKFNANPALLEGARDGDLKRVMAALENGADKTVTDDAGNSSVHLAVQSGARELVLYMVAQNFAASLSNTAGFTPLTYAISGGHFDILNDLAAAGANVNHATPSMQETPLMDATYRNAPALVAALLAAGAKVDAQDANGVTAFMRAAGQDNVDCLMMLMEAGADPYLASKSGRTAYDFAKRTRAEGTLAQLDRYIPEYTVRSAQLGQAKEIKTMKKLTLCKPDYTPLG